MKPAVRQLLLSKGRTAIRLLAMAASRRVDLVMIGDSHQLQNGNGYDDGFGLALAKRYGMYATPLYSQENAGTQYTNTGHASASFPGATGATTGAPAAHDVYAVPQRAYLYTAVGDMGASNGVIAFASPSANIDVSANLRGHFAYGTFSTGAGSFVPAARQDASPFATLATGASVSTNTGTDGRAIVTLDVSAASRAYDVAFRWRLPGGTASVGPTNLFWLRIENRDRLSGISVHTLYCIGGTSAYDMAAFIQGLSDAQLKQYMQDVVYLQVQRGQTPMCVFYCSSGHNDRNEISQPSLGPNPSTVADSAAAYVDNMTAIYTRLRAMWIAAGYDSRNFGFLVIPSHPVDSIPDDPKLISYRTAIEQWAAGKTDVAYVNLAGLVSNTSIAANGGYAPADTIHLNQAAYQYVAQKVVDTIR